MRLSCYWSWIRSDNKSLHSLWVLIEYIRVVFILLSVALDNFFNLFVSLLVCLTVFHEIFLLISPWDIKHKLFSGSFPLLNLTDLIIFAFFLLTSFIPGILWYHQIHQIQIHQFHQMGHHHHYRKNHFLAKSYYQTFLVHSIEYCHLHSWTTVQQHEPETAVILYGVFFDIF